MNEKPEVPIGSFIHINKTTMSIKEQDKLMHAAQSGDLKSVKRLADSVIDINGTGNSANRMTSLHGAAKHGHLKTCQFLRSKGAKLDLKDTQGNTPLIWACFNRHIPVIKWLIEEGINLDESDSIGYTGLHEASDKGQLAVAKCLVEAKANVEARTRDGYTPLYCAAKDGHLELIKFLYKSGGDIQAENNEGSTPLILACNNGHPQTAKWLVEKGCDVNHANHAGSTCLHAACQEGHVKIVKHLIHFGAKIDITNENGFTPLMLAQAKGHSNVVAFLNSNNSRNIKLCNRQSKKHTQHNSGVPKPISETAVQKLANDKKTRSVSTTSNSDRSSYGSSNNTINQPKNSVDTVSSTSVITDLSISISSIELNEPIQGKRTFGQVIKPATIDQIMNNDWKQHEAKNEYENVFDEMSVKSEGGNIDPLNNETSNHTNQQKRHFSASEIDDKMSEASCTEKNRICCQPEKMYLRRELQKLRKENEVLKRENKSLKEEKANSKRQKCQDCNKKIPDNKSIEVAKKALQLHIYDTAIDTCELKATSATHLTTLLLQQLFTRQHLAEHSAGGNTERPGLEPKKIEALLEFVKSKHKNVEETKLISAINQKCADIRKADRKRKMTVERSDKKQQKLSKKQDTVMEVDNESDTD